ncbi:uncharacterized protein TNCV_1684341 [Trichonephila clavipes]|nr:uncharacterized protein TNCV_1684341 [Trichonephila clavipes]
MVSCYLHILLQDVCDYSTESDEIGNLIEEAVDLARQINSEEDSDDIQELLDSCNQELTTDELIQMQEQEQDIEALESADPVQSEDRITVAARGLLAMDHVILNHGQVTWTTPELAPPLLTTTSHQREDVSALDRFSVHRCPTRRVFSGTGLELVTKPATIRCLYHSATAAVSFVTLRELLCLEHLLGSEMKYKSSRDPAE